ncbi:MAG TPA: hypothetical protein VFA97_00995 [Gaiellaceae bacterium]|nr:hypothetical protein [Gaiellaceae bacterium]
MAPKAGTPEHYAEEMGELWTGLTRTLGRLDRLAAEPERLDEDEVERALRRLQYSLHLAGEHAYGVEPPDGSQTAHAELADALRCARDTTAEVADAVEDDGADAAAPLLHEWRGALFRLRLARLRLAAQPRKRQPLELPLDEPIGRPLLAFLLALGGALAFVAGATLAVWPLWVLGLVAVCASVLALRP